MTMVDKPQHPTTTAAVLPSVERIQRELASATSIDDFFGKEGIFARLFAGTLEQMLEAELTLTSATPRMPLRAGTRATAAMASAVAICAPPPVT